ncbi:Uncharacterised protein [Mycobacteroides abscessus subsp. abscessus]|nr:Uncharacterised protein [Mycobacteroides abscessus subsp. abscessus]
MLGVGAALSIPFRNRRELDLDHLDREVLDREVTEG